MAGQKEFDQLLGEHLIKYYKDMLGLEDYRSRIEIRRHEVPRQVRILRVISEVAGIDPVGKKFLDVGCGWGGSVVGAAQLGMDAYGCDIDRDALEISRLRAGLAGVRVNLSSSATGIPYPDETFDVIFCQSVLEHIPQPEPVIREICRVLKKGGFAYIEAPNYRKFIEPHYKIIFFPKLSRRIAKRYLSLIGRPTEFIDTISYIDDRSLSALFRNVGGIEVENVGDRFSEAFIKMKAAPLILPKVEERLSLGFRLMRRLVAIVDSFCEKHLRIKNVHMLVKK